LDKVWVMDVFGEKASADANGRWEVKAASAHCDSVKETGVSTYRVEDRLCARALGVFIRGNAYVPIVYNR
jgi:hypothetical protein